MSISPIRASTESQLSSNFRTLPSVIHPDILKELEQESCSICLENFNMTDSMPIVYHYMRNGKPMCPQHEECFRNWAKVKPICPIDRLSITSINGVPIPTEETAIRAHGQTVLNNLR
jgi:hypothetical protein